MESWLIRNQNHSVLVVRYEELATRTRRELLKVLRFLDAPYSVSKLVGVQWTEGGPGEMRGDVFKDSPLECVTAAIKKCEEMLSVSLHSRNIDLTSYYYRKDRFV